MRQLMIPPPPVPESPELRWLLARAFGPLPLPLPAVHSGRVVDLARRLGLGARIGRRTPMQQLELEVGRAQAREFGFELLRVTATNRALAAAMSDVAVAASAIDLPLVWLKHAALWSSGVVGEGLRDARDVDVLVASARTAELQRALLTRGYREASPRAPGYHLAPLVSQSGACVEVHERLWGVDLGSDADATADALLQRDLTSPLVSAQRVRVPNASLLVAHAMVHGLVQHFTSPAAYAPLRCIADLIDLHAWRFAPQVIVALAPRQLSLEMVEAGLELSRALSRAESLRDLQAPAAELLAHVVGASVDQRYRLALRALRIRELHQQGQLGTAALRFIGAREPGSAPAPLGRERSATWKQRAIEAGELSLGLGLLAYSRLRRR